MKASWMKQYHTERHIRKVTLERSCCAQSRPTLQPHGLARQAPLSMGFCRQEYWSELPFPPPGDLPNTGIERVSLASSALTGEFFTTETPRKLPCQASGSVKTLP